MTREEKIAIADMVRNRDRFGPVSPEELAALPGKEKELWVHTKNGKTKQIATVKNKIQGWTFHNNAIKRISHKVIPNIPTTNGKNSTFPVCISTDVF